jgi:hypothetical protein
LRWQAISEFAKQYEIFAALDDDAESIRASDRHKPGGRGGIALHGADLGL